MTTDTLIQDIDALLKGEVSGPEQVKAVLLEALPYLWLPIETAPRDGTEFLAYGNYVYPGDRSPTHCIKSVWYSGDDEMPWENDEGIASPSFYSHWMPLPSAPVTKDPTP